MELKDKLIASFMAFEEQVDVNADLHDVRTLAIKNFEEKGFPTKKEEAWKYTSLNTILKNDFSVFPKRENSIESGWSKLMCFRSSIGIFELSL